MKAKVTGVSAWQETPISGTLDIEVPRYVDSAGRASVSRYTGVLNAAKTGWANSLRPSEDLWLIVQGPDDPQGVRGAFRETLVYANRTVVTEFSRVLRSSDLTGLIFDYNEPVFEPEDLNFGEVPLTMRAAAAAIEQQQADHTRATQDHQQVADSLIGIAQDRVLAQAAAAQALGVAGISATYVSSTTADPPAAPDGTRGAKRDASGNLVLLTRTAGAWVPDALALASVNTVTGLTPDPDTGLRPITPADLAPGMPMMHQRVVLLDRPRAGGALPGLGGVPMSVWDWEFQPMPWLTERELGAGELYVRAQIFGFTSATYPLRVRVLNTTFNQSADITIADVPDDENSGAGFYRWKRSAWLPIRDVTLLGRRVTPTLQCQILAPSGVVELWYLALEFAWRR